ncbi:uncharacterized mitochondrial protein AtMg00810-like [Lathyrus oleraceus]|uniref:uncharacterized mitochondrial protein AtMg00810-like n=1 Tax=Pisum sativum TaxID=3888 RepID=UPI0021CFBB20|nr:uncharacterized mitochondrial protein AtMg00810-like [Pisum sativum]
MEYGVYVQHTSNNNMILVYFYVDNILLTESCSNEMVKFKKMLMNEFEMTNLRNMTYFLRMEIMYSKKVVLHQMKYELEFLKRFELMNYKSAITPTETNHKLDSDVEGDEVDAITFKQLVGSLGYLCNTRPDTYYVVGMMSRFMNKPKCFVCLSRYVDSELAVGSEDQGEQAVKLMIDNKSVISLAKNSVMHERRKHIDTKFHFLRN